MTTRQLTDLRAALLRLYEEHHDPMTPREEEAVTTIRDFIMYELEERD